jgi:kynurenine 3-monooxygenase
MSVRNVLDESFVFPTGHMISTKCFPWIYKGNMALIGDAAHTLFPYYGQGANCAFEDCEVLAACYSKTPNDWKTILSKYQSIRKPNSDTIIDLAAEHLQVLSTKVGNAQYQLAEKISLAVQKAMPDLRTLYHNISFTTIPYQEAVKREEVFQAVIQALMQIENIQTKIDTAEWTDICMKTFAEVVRKSATNKNSTTGHSYAGTLFFFKSPKEKTIPEPKAQNSPTLFKSHET